ncbi:asparaginase [Chungangia koreensis]|uniref:asparaginase n=1 Tax=Chungangia koreensis TaxID=752657 RepID=A0ABV8X8L5_9LACT
MKRKVSVITTGGTIASKPIENGLLNSGAITGEELAALCQLPEEIEIKIIDVFQLPSMHIGFKEMLKIRDVILNEFEDPDVSGIVVTHGTDSLEETAYFLDLTIADERTVVITGSQRSPFEVGSDVFSNLSNSILVASEPATYGSGTVVVFNERIYSARYIRKVHSSNLQAFDVFGHGYLGIIDSGVVRVYQKPVNREVYKNLHKEPKVDIIKCYSGASGTVIEALVDDGVEGIILEGVGRGQVSPYMMPAINKAVSKGVHVVVTTSAEEGRVYPAYDYLGSAADLMRNGVVLGGDYNSKKARIKVAVLLASGNTIDKTVFEN